MIRYSYLPDGFGDYYEIPFRDSSDEIKQNCSSGTFEEGIKI
jgi:hypothetical protein